MGDITSTAVLIIKGALFLLLTLLAGTTVLLMEPWQWEAPALLIALWAAARTYYFLFYVLEHYVGLPGPYAGVLHQLRTLFTEHRRDRPRK